MYNHARKSRNKRKFVILSVKKKYTFILKFFSDTERVRQGVANGISSFIQMTSFSTSDIITTLWVRLFFRDGYLVTTIFFIMDTLWVEQS